MSGIYAITNILTDTVYYGQSIRTLDKRLRKHKEALKRGKHKNRHLQNSWNKYGEGAFIFAPVRFIEGSSKELTPIEKCYIDNAYYLGLNVFNIREPNNKLPLSKEHREQLSKSHIGIIHSDVTRQKLSSSLKGHVVSEETKAKIGAANKIKRTGTTLSKETRERISKTLIGNKRAFGCKHTEEMKKKKSETSKKIWLLRKCKESN